MMIIKLKLKLNLDLFNVAGYPRRGELLRTPIFYFTTETIWKKRHIRMGDLTKQAWQDENPHYYNHYSIMSRPGREPTISFRLSHLSNCSAIDCHGHSLWWHLSTLKYSNDQHIFQRTIRAIGLFLVSTVMENHFI